VLDQERLFVDANQLILIGVTGVDNLFVSHVEVIRTYLIDINVCWGLEKGKNYGFQIAKSMH
jgi:hypothetical protein